MKTIQIRLPDPIHEKVRELAQEEGISMNHFVVSSVSNEVVRQETRDFFKQAATKFDPHAFAEALAAISDETVQEGDEM